MADTICHSCLTEKQTQDVIPRKSATKHLHILYQVYSNLCGKMPVLTPAQHQYFMTFIDGYSSHVSVALLKAKSKALENIQGFIACAEVITNKCVNFF